MKISIYTPIAKHRRKLDELNIDDEIVIKVDTQNYYCKVRGWNKYQGSIFVLRVKGEPKTDKEIINILKRK